MATVIVNPDRYLANQPPPRELSPNTMRLKLRAAGLDPKLARAKKPRSITVRLDFWKLEKVEAQRQWSSVLRQMCTGAPR